MKKSVIFRALALILAAVIGVCAFTGCSKGREGSSGENTTVKFEMEIAGKDAGYFIIELYPEHAPITVENFIKLVEKKYYDGLTFHRIIDGFMAQGGMNEDKPADSIKGEFAINGIENNLEHDRGIVSMARTQDPDSASSQFFICYSREHTQHLDGQYAAFGKVIEGMDVVDSFLDVERTYGGDGAKSSPVEDIVIKAAYIVDYEKNETSGDAGTAEPAGTTEQTTQEPAKTEPEIPEGHPKVKFEMNIAGKAAGSFVIELYPEHAPLTVVNFMKLVENKFYNGLTFHRIIDGFMAQGGRSTTEKAEQIKGEFSANGVENNLQHDRGIVSMARTNMPNSASSQFFICYSREQTAHLDGNYAAFGKVIEGMDVVDSFLEVELTYGGDGAKSQPVEDIVIKAAYIVE